MPTGFWDSLNASARFIEWMQPKRVLDVGIGGGRMGFLAREYGSKEGIPRYLPGVQVVDGIEGYAPYVGPLQEAIYDEIILDEALSALESLASRYDLVIAADILEHFVDPDADRFLRLVRDAGDVTLVITPAFDMPQESEVNPLENHRSFWPADRLRSAGAGLVEQSKLSVIALFGDRRIIEAYAAETSQRVTLKDRLPPELRRWLREKRHSLGVARH